MKRCRGECGKESVYLVQDALLDKKVSFPFIKMPGRGMTTRITRMDQNRGQLCLHPSMVSQFNLGEIAHCYSHYKEEDPVFKRPVRIS